MALDRALGEEQAVRDLGVGLASRDHCEDGVLAMRERGRKDLAATRLWDRDLTGACGANRRHQRLLELTAQHDPSRAGGDHRPCHPVADRSQDDHHGDARGALRRRGEIRDTRPWGSTRPRPPARRFLLRGEHGPLRVRSAATSMPAAARSCSARALSRRSPIRPTEVRTASPLLRARHDAPLASPCSMTIRQDNGRRTGRLLWTAVSGGEKLEPRAAFGPPLGQAGPTPARRATAAPVCLPWR